MMLDVLPFDPHAWVVRIKHFFGGPKKHTAPSGPPGFAGAFLLGASSGTIAAPCTTPVLASILAYIAKTQSIGMGLALMIAFSLGLSTLLLLIAGFAGAIKVLPRPGAWMETFKQFMAFPLYATVGYLVWVLAGQTGDEGLQNVLFGLVLVALGIWIYGRWHAPGASAGRARFGVAGLIVVAGAGLWLGWPHPVGTATESTSATPAIVWEPWSPEAVAKLRAEGRVVYVDFTARWCATCQANKKLVFHSDDVLRYFATNKIATLRGDWTNKDPRITAELAKYHRSAVPFNVIWLPGQNDPILLPELLTPGLVLDALRQN
jgi:thiol:disulfide interchange protein DsbD